MPGVAGKGGTALVALALMTTVGWALPVYREAPPPAHTGGFGEPVCSECHFGSPMNAEPGSLRVEVPERYEPGASYAVEVVLEHPDLAAAGFQLAARFADGPRRGEQAGSIHSVTPPVGLSRTAIMVDTMGVQYAHQTLEGAALTAAGEARWRLEWTAPESNALVAIHAAANAANDDASEFGDFIYTAEARIPGEAAGMTAAGSPLSGTR